MEHWAKNFLSKILTENMFKTRLDNFGNDFGHFCNFENFLIFWKHFKNSTLHGTLSKKKFSNKLPQNLFKTRLDNFGNDFGLFWNFEKFWYFENISKTRPYMEHWAKKNFSKSTPKHVESTFGQFGNDFGHFWKIWKFFGFLKTFRRPDPAWNTGQKKLFEKYPKTCWKHFWTVWERFWAFLENLKIVRLFENISKTRPCMEHWAKNKFPKKVPQNMFKTLLDNLGTILGVFAILKPFKFF